jgi:hypothetical protein
MGRPAEVSALDHRFACGMQCMACNKLCYGSGRAAGRVGFHLHPHLKTWWFHSGGAPVGVPVQFLGTYRGEGVPEKDVQRR